MKYASKKDEEDDGETIIGDDSELKYPEEDYSYIPLYSVPNAVTEALVGQSPAPEDYKKDKDIGDKAVKDDWKEYFASQDRLKYLLLALLALLLVVPLWGLLCCLCCGRCRRRSGYSRCMRYCCMAMLAMAAILMLLSLVFAIMAAVQLNKSLKSASDCHSESSGGGGKSGDNDLFGYRRRSLSGTNYNQLLRHIEAQSDAARALVRAEAMRNLSEVLRNMQGAKPLLEELRVELPVAKGLAIRFRDALRAVKQSLKVFLTSQCDQAECGDFYRDNEIRLLDEGCLHYDRLPSMEDFTKSIEEILAGIFVNYPVLGAQQIIKAIRNPMDKLLYKKDFYKNVNKLTTSNKASVIELRANNNGTPRKDNKKGGSSPAAALRKKMGPSWYRNTLGWLAMLLFLPILLLIGILTILFSCKYAKRLLCAFKIIAITLFVLSMLLLLFFLVHGALAHQIFCAEKSGGSKSMDLWHYISVFRSGDALPRCVRNESLYGDWIGKELYVKKKDALESLEKPDSSPILGNLSSNPPQDAAVDQELLGDNFFSYNSSQFNRHMCQELVPEPKPGPLPGLISRLNNLTSSLGSSPFLLNQSSYLRAVHKELGQPLAAIVQRVLAKLRQLDHLLSGGYGSLARYMSSLLEKIKLGDLSQKVSGEVASNLGNGTKYGMESCTPQTRQKFDMDRSVQVDDFCKRIANPMNALWFWLLVFSLLLVPALCCSNYLRCRLCICRRVCCCGDYSGTHSRLPMELEAQRRCYRYLPVCSGPMISNPIKMPETHCEEHFC